MFCMETIYQFQAGETKSPDKRQLQILQTALQHNLNNSIVVKTSSPVFSDTIICLDSTVHCSPRMLHSASHLYHPGFEGINAALVDMTSPSPSSTHFHV